MLSLRHAQERGHANHGWLDSHHTFSFADYHDEDHMGFGVLRVINEDRVQAGAGFGTHGHRDMEIITYVLEGELEHRDSMGTVGKLRPGDVQRMSAGTGVRHSEANSGGAPLHFLQIWVLPEKQGTAPGYEQKHFPEAERAGKFRTVVSPGGSEGGLDVHQDVKLASVILGAGQSATQDLAKGRRGWLQVARGSGTLNGVAVKAGDGVAITEESKLELSAKEPLEALLFDLP